MMSYSRLPFAAARDGFFFRWLAAVHPTKHFPHWSLLVVGAMTTAACLFTLDFIIAAAVSSRILIQFIGQIVGLTLLRRDMPGLRRPFSMWLYPIPSVVAFFGFAFIFISSGVSAVGLGLAWLVAGGAFYLYWAWKHCEWPFQTPVTTGVSSGL
jgi:amino acid transporter